ncbi:hypothetical protein [Orenia marismortui]|uniref:hypothetical protein n=1 Tax=Orenia marismortui TaxID=46469 RepID=UPI0012FCA08F|nr:hypothetical protein [Orenia marismortui]
MGFLPSEDQRKSKERTQKPQNDRIDLLLLDNGKKIGLSFEEMNEMRVCDLLEMIEIDIGGGVQNRSAPPASQRDIDKLFA